MLCPTSNLSVCQDGASVFHCPPDLPGVLQLRFCQTKNCEYQLSKSTDV